MYCKQNFLRYPFLADLHILGFRFPEKHDYTKYLSVRLYVRVFLKIFTGWCILIENFIDVFWFSNELFIQEVSKNVG